ncbi:phosphotransferase family protein [Saccharopolyspora cebuensis]|uniref:phosphotransferase family protein n=1 Tax=Saccharopolyspora cebuensis TaxID=418759 RepID=UPI0031E6282F
MNADDPDELARSLGARLHRVLGAPVRVTGLERASGGASRETWLFAARPEGAGGARELVLRRDPVRAPRPEGMAREAAALAAAARSGVAVPELVDHGTDPGVLGAPYLITGKVGGESIARRLLRDEEYADARRGLARELGRQAARVHRIPPESVPGLSTEDPLERLIADYDALGEPLPAVEIAFRWLREHRPPAPEPAVVHGDFRTGNLLVDRTGLRAVLDWELVHLGDPVEDLGWLCVKAWRFGSASPAGGFGTRDELLDGYAEVAGRRPDPAALRWWEVFGTARWGVICRAQAERHLSGAQPSVELAAIGRRVCEQEHDLLEELAIPRPAPVPEAVPEVISELHGSPAAADLVAAVAGFLRDEVLPGQRGHLRFQSRVAANALAVVERELRHGAGPDAAHRDRLAALGFPGTAALAGAIRRGEVRGEDPRVAEAVWRSVLDRLAVANPRHGTDPRQGGTS